MKAAGRLGGNSGKSKFCFGRGQQLGIPPAGNGEFFFLILQDIARFIRRCRDPFAGIKSSHFLQEVSSCFARGKHRAVGHMNPRGIDIQKSGIFKIFRSSILLIPRKRSVLPGNKKQKQQLNKLQIPGINAVRRKGIDIDIPDLDMVYAILNKIVKSVCAARLQADRVVELACVRQFPVVNIFLNAFRVSQD